MPDEGNDRLIIYKGSTAERSLKLKGRVRKLAVDPATNTIIAYLPISDEEGRKVILLSPTGKQIASISVGGSFTDFALSSQGLIIVKDVEGDLVLERISYTPERGVTADNSVMVPGFGDFNPRHWSSGGVCAADSEIVGLKEDSLVAISPSGSVKLLARDSSFAIEGGILNFSAGRAVLSDEHGISFKVFDLKHGLCLDSSLVSFFERDLKGKVGKDLFCVPRDWGYITDAIYQQGNIYFMGPTADKIVVYRISIVEE